MLGTGWGGDVRGRLEVIYFQKGMVKAENDVRTSVPRENWTYQRGYPVSLLGTWEGGATIVLLSLSNHGAMLQS